MTLKTQNKNEKTKVVISYIDSLNKFKLEKTSKSWSDKSAHSSYWCTSRKTQYVDYDELKKYNDYIAIIVYTNSSNEPSKVKNAADDEKVICDIFEGKVYKKPIDKVSDIWVKDTTSDTLEKCNTLNDIREKYNILYMPDILRNKNKNYKNSSNYVFSEDTQHPSLKDIMNNTPVTTKENEEVNDLDTLLNGIFDNKNEVKSCAAKKTKDKCTVVNTDKETKIVPIVEGKTPVIYFDGTLAQNLAVFYSFYKVEEGKHYIPTENKYFIYYPETKSYDETPYLLYETKDFEVINVIGYLSTIRDEISDSTYGERIFDYIVSWFQFEMSDKSMIATLLTSTKPFTILLDNKKIEGYNKLLENPARFKEIIKYLENKLGKSLTWGLDDNNVLHLTFERNFFID